MNLELLSGLNIPMLLAIVFIVAMIKQADKQGKLKNLMIFVHVLVTAGAVLFVTSPFSLKSYIGNIIVYSAITGYGYDFLKKGAFERFGKKVVDEEKKEEKRND